MRTQPSEPGVARYPIQAVSRALAIMQLLAKSPDRRSLGVTEIAAKLAVSKSTAHRLLTTLADSGVVGKDRATGKYRLGWALYELAHGLPHPMGLHALAEPLMAEAARDLPGPSYLAIRDGSSVLVVHSCPGPGSNCLLMKGVPYPIHCSALGKALLLDLSRAETREIVGPDPLEAVTVRTIRSVKALFEDLALARRRGYASDAEEVVLGVTGLSVPVRGYLGQIVGSVGITLPGQDLGEAEVQGPVGRLRSLALQLSRRIGFDGESSI